MFLISKNKKHVFFFNIYTYFFKKIRYSNKSFFRKVRTNIYRILKNKKNHIIYRISNIIFFLKTFEFDSNERTDLHPWSSSVLPFIRKYLFCHFFWKKYFFQNFYKKSSYHQQGAWGRFLPLIGADKFTSKQKPMILIGFKADEHKKKPMTIFWKPETFLEN